MITNEYPEHVLHAFGCEDVSENCKFTPGDAVVWRYGTSLCKMTLGIVVSATIPHGELNCHVVKVLWSNRK